MKITRNNHVYQQIAGENDGGAGGAAAADQAGAAAAAAAGTGGAPAGGQGSAAGAGAGAGTGAASVLAAGKEAPAGNQGDDFIPEKFRVLDAEGKLDVTASARKVAENYTALEKRMGTGDLPPKTAEEYAPEGLPEGINFDEIKADPLYQGFLKGAHAKGLTNAQVSYVLSEYLARAPEVAAAAKEVDATAAAVELKQTWPDEASFKANLGHAYRATSAIAAKAGIDIATIEASPLANNPIFVRLMAALGPEFGEDTSAAAGASQIAAGDFDSRLAEIRSHEGYANVNHPMHKQLMAKKQALYESRYGKTPAPGVTVIPKKVIPGQ